MVAAERVGGRVWTAEEFLATDQTVFGRDWRYELVGGLIIGHAALSLDHAAITASLAACLVRSLRGHESGCRAEIGSGAVPQYEQRNTARIPDVLIRCGVHPRVVFEVVSPSELRHWRLRDEKRRDLQRVVGVMEIVEIYQAECAVHVYRRMGDDTWAFSAIGGQTAQLHLASVGIAVDLAELYAGIDLETRPDP